MFLELILLVYYNLKSTITSSCMFLPSKNGLILYPCILATIFVGTFLISLFNSLVLLLKYVLHEVNVSLILSISFKSLLNSFVFNSSWSFLTSKIML